MGIIHAAGATVGAIVSSGAKFWDGTAWGDTLTVLSAAEGATGGGFSRYAYPTAALMPADGETVIEVTYTEGAAVLERSAGLSEVAGVIDGRNVVRLSNSCNTGCNCG